MDQLSVSFASFLFGQERSVKKSLMISPNIILPLTKEATSKYVYDISGNSIALNNLFSSCIIPLEGIVGGSVYKQWRKLYANFLDPNQNIAIGNVPGWDTIHGAFEKGQGFIRETWPLYSWGCSACLFKDHGIPSFSDELEMRGMAAKIRDMTHDKKIDFNLFRVLDEIVFMNVDGLHWDQIAEIRDSKYFKAFIKTLSTLKVEEMNRPVGAHYLIIKDLFELISQSHSGLTKSILKAIFCNLPIPPINPLSVADSVNQIRQNIDIGSKYGYLFFINEVRTKSSVNS